ncbi:guanine nucleotide exchange factor VAV3 isoform X2 [Ixodes scapularis]|uniref:guanine nucleotide exchange factor VAV3 isoform X2 n=1 Tax=Ixodes scapularis TaxID=6945 RepID=UPI001AD67811|nr:guanine nucleotide exchange factor VAV3 isoform X2 [Ixodes scapularis]
MADVLWRDCADWLVRCQALPPDHRVTWGTAQLIDLANTLRDGVLLCQLLNKLLPGCVDLKEMSLRPQMSQFLCLKNIRTFLQTCKNVFNLNNTDLFEPHMLFEYGDFKQVLHTLSVLSRSPKAEASGVRGFADKSSASHDYYNDEAFNLENAVNNEAFGEFGEYEYETVNHDDEDIYEDLCAFRRIPVPTTPAAPLEKRDYCIKELIETEKNYIEALNMITRDFMRPLKDVLTPEENEVIFKHIKELADTHAGFHADLHKACLVPQQQQMRISDCFLRWKDKFIVYGDYCSNLPKAQEQIDELCTKKQLVNQCVLNCQQKANDGKFKLRDLLSVPMQRVLKYHLLLKELMKNTTETHEDYHGLEKALKSMLDLAHYINEVKRDNETLQIIADIQASITDVDLPQNMELKDYGRLLKDGELKIKSHDDNNKIKNRYIFIFDRMMLMCKSTKGEQYIYKSSLALCDYRLENAPVNSRMATRYYWFLVHIEKKTAYTMYAKTEEMKKKWIEAIEKAMDNINPSIAKDTDHQFAMHTFKVPTYCSDCNKLLPGIFYQGYICSVCGTGVHKTCLATVRSCGAPSLPPRPGSHMGSQSSTDEPQTPLRLYPDPGTNGIRFSISIAKAKQSYNSSGPGYLSFAADDIIEVLRRISSTIWEGRLQRTSEEGLFPASCVEELDKRGSYECPAPLGRGHAPLFPVPHTPPPLPSNRDGYVNLNLEEYPWFAGTMERDGATAVLEKSPSGTFLLRISTKQNGGYAISINFDSQVKHMRVCYDDGQFYLSESKMFRSIVELVSWYETHSLSESFKGLEISLLIPFKNVVPSPITNGTSMLCLSPTEPLGRAVALHNFQPTADSMLGLIKGDVVTVLSKAGQEKGWWKGQIQERVGYFPWQYVQELPSAGAEC